MRLTKILPSSPYTRIDTMLFPSGYFVRSTRENVLLGLGGNVGDVVRVFEKLIWTLKRSSFIQVVATSAILKNPPFGYLEQPFFYNAVVVIQTSLSPKRLLSYLQKLEKRFGRKRLFPNAPRTLDIDIIRYGTRKIETPFLTLPHPHALRRPSVTIPISWIKGV